MVGRPRPGRDLVDGPPLVLGLEGGPHPEPDLVVGPPRPEPDLVDDPRLDPGLVVMLRPEHHLVVGPLHRPVRDLGVDLHRRVRGLGVGLHRRVRDLGVDLRHQRVRGLVVGPLPPEPDPVVLLLLGRHLRINLHLLE